MRSPDSHIHELICNLSLGERDAYHNWVNGLPRYPAYHDLFLIIDGQKSYDEESTKAAFLSIHPQKTFKAVKNQLKEILFRFLVRGFGDPERTPFEHVKLIHALYERGQIQLALRELGFAKKKLKKREQFPYIIELLEFELELLLESSSEIEFEKSRGPILKEIESVEAQYSNLRDFKRLHIAYYFSFRKKYHQRGEVDFTLIKKISDEELLSDENMALSVRAKREFFLQKTRVEFFSLNLEESLKNLHSLFELYEENAFLKEEFIAHYYKVVSMICTHYIHLGKIEPAIQWLKKLEMGFPGVRYLDKQVKERYCQNLIHLLNQGDSYPGLHSIPDLAPLIEDTLSTGPFSLYDYRLAFIGAGYFQNKRNYKQSNKYLKRIIENPNQDVGVDVQSLARIIELLNFLALADWDMIDYKLRTYKRFLRKVDCWGEFEVELFRLLGQILKIPVGSKKTSLIQEFLGKIPYLLSKGKYDQYRLLFDFEKWFKGHLQL